MNVKQKPNNIVKLTIFIALFIMLVLGGTYAVMINMSYNTENVIASIGSRPVFTSSATNDIVMNEIPYIGQISETEYEIANDTDNLSISLSTGYTTVTICTYDVVWQWDGTSAPYYKTVGANKEFTVSGVSTDGQVLNEVQLNDYSPDNLKTILYTGVISASDSTIVSTNWTFTTHFYKTQPIQTGHQGMNYFGKIYVDNVICSKPSYSAYWIGNCNGQNCIFPQYGVDPINGLTIYQSGYSSGHNIYIGQDDTKYHLCMLYNSHEVCFSQPYTQYGPITHTIDTSFSTEQQTALLNSILNEFNSAGINLTANDCEASLPAVGCTFGDMRFMIYGDGSIIAFDDDNGDACVINGDGSASC